MGEGFRVAMAAEPARALTAARGGAWQQSLARMIQAAGRGHAPVRVRVTEGRLSMPLVPGGQPFRIVLLAGLKAGLPPLRWAIVGGRPGRMRGSGLDPAAGAIGLLASAAASRERIAATVGDPATDTLLGDLAPAFAALLADLTDRQREVGRLLLIDGLRRSEIATRLEISRPTVSVMVDRARLTELEGLARGLDRVLASALE